MSKFASVATTIACVCLLAVLITIFRISADMHALRTEVEQQRYQIERDQALQGVRSQLRDVGQQVQQQTVVTNRALGKIIPYALPEDVDRDIKQIEASLASPARRPANREGVEAVRAKLASVVDRLPPWAQEEILPRLVPLRWDIEALWNLTAQPADDRNALATYSSSVDELLANQPIGAHEDLASKLTARQQETNGRITAAEKATAIAKVREALQSPGDLEKMEVAARFISAYDDQKSLAADLNRAILKLSLTESATALDKNLASYGQLADQTLKEYAVGRTHESVINLRLRANAAELKDGELDKRLDSLQQRTAAAVTSAAQLRARAAAARVREYQVWALTEIGKVPSFQSLLNREVNKIPSSIQRMNVLSSAYVSAKTVAMRSLQGSMIEHLATIDQGALDVAVGEWYRKVFEDRFSRLDEGGQLTVVTGFANAPKRPL